MRHASGTESGITACTCLFARCVQCLPPRIGSAWAERALSREKDRLRRRSDKKERSLSKAKSSAKHFAASAAINTYYRPFGQYHLEVERASILASLTITLSPWLECYNSTKVRHCPPPKRHLLWQRPMPLPNRSKVSSPNSATTLTARVSY